MKIKVLKEMSTIQISNVDKKIKENEFSVKLCNYTDVYYNWGIYSEMISDFMTATAKKNEVEKFVLQKNDVVITKDSETKNDIGKSAIIIDELKNCVLGYHCALIRPNNIELDGSYLNAVLNTEYAKKYFELNAGGSGQRFYLNIDIIENMPVPIIPIKKQKEIGKFFNDIDKKIYFNNKINDNLSKQAETIILYTLNNTNETIQLSQLIDFINGYAFESKSYTTNGKYKIITIKNVQDGMVSSKKSLMLDKLPSDIDSNCILQLGDILISLTGDVGRVGIVNENNLLLNQRVAKFNVKNELYKAWIYFYFKLNSTKQSLEKISGGSNQKNLSPIETLRLFIKFDEKIIDKYNKNLNSIFLQLLNNQRENIELYNMRDYLLPLLINGQATIL